MLEVCPMTLKEANAFVEQYHRHHKPVTGHKFSIGCTDGDKIVGVAIVGRPVSRYLDDGWTLEVNRLCTDGTHNACSMLYAAAWRAARAMGYHKLITYILDTESGTSLKAAATDNAELAADIINWVGAEPNERVKVMEAINNAAVAYIEGGPYENDLPGMELALKIDRLSRDFVRPPEGEEE